MHYYYSQFCRSSPPTGQSAPLFQHLYVYIKQGILNGTLSHTSKIPPTRELAQHLGVSRNTVLTVMSMLKSEGLITTTIGGGTFVQYPLSPHHTNPPPPVLSEWASQIKSRTRHHTGICALGVPDSQSFPINAIKKAFGESFYTALSHSNRTGHTNFIEQIMAFVHTTHGIIADADMIIPIPSTQSGYDVILKTLFDKWHTILLDCPCYMDITTLIKSMGIRIIPHIISPENPPDYTTAPTADATFITPAHQYPLGYTMSPPTRLGLVQWATQNNAWIIEDSTDSIHTPTQTTPLFSMCPEHTLFIGSFSKILSPSIKVAFIIAPRTIAKKIRTTAHICGQEPSVFMQATLAHMLQSGRLYRHITQTQKLYKHRLNHLKQTVPQILPIAHIPDTVQSGLQTPLILPPTIIDTTVSHALYQDGYGIKPLSSYCHTLPIHTHPHICGLHLGFGNTDTNTLSKTLQHIQNHIHQMDL